MEYIWKERGMETRNTLIAITFILLTSIPASAALKAGFAERDITPDIGMEQPGGYGKVFHRIRHDPCKVRASVWDDGQTRVALVGIDTLIIRKPQVIAARKLITEKTGIPGDCVMIGASHTHSGGPTGMIL